MHSTLSLTEATLAQSVVSTYKSHADAEAAVRRLSAGGLPLKTISIIGRDFQAREDIQGFYHPIDGAVDGAGQGAWFGGIFGLMLGAMGFFVVPGIGGLMALGPLSGMIAGAIGGAGVGALVNAFIVAGVPHDQALKYQESLRAGEFVVVVHGGDTQAKQAHEILATTAPTALQIHSGSNNLQTSERNSKW